MRKFLRSKSILIKFIVLILAVLIPFSSSISPIYAASFASTSVPPQPTLNYPYSTGTKVTVTQGLHDHNYAKIVDDTTHTSYTLNNSGLSTASVDVAPAKLSSPTVALAHGIVLAVEKNCHRILISYSNDWWAIYLHQANFQVKAGDTVNAGTPVSYANTKEPPSCGEVTTGPHTHFAFLTGSGTTGTYTSMLGVVLCGHAVQSNGTLKGLPNPFTVPACPSTDQIIEYPVPTSSSNPDGITSGPDGNLWFTEASGNKISKMTPSGTFTEYPVPTSNSGLENITSGPDGNLWFTEDQVNRIGRITPTGTITEFPIPTSSSYPEDITSGPDGNLWFTEYFGNKIGRITTSGKITEFPLSNSNPNYITKGPDGNLWFTEYGANKIGRITTSGKITEFPIPTSNSNPKGITTGPDGNLWFTEVSGNKIGRITTSGSITGEFPVPTSGSHPWVIITGPDGNLWFTEFFAVNIGSVTTSGSITEFPLPNGGAPDGITAVPLNSVWFTEWNGNKIGQITL